MVKKIVHLCTDSNIGGTETMLLTLIKNWELKNYQHIVITLIHNGPLLKLAEQYGAQIFSINMKYKLDITALYRLYKYLKKHPPDILQSYLYHCNILGRLMRKLLSIPIMISGQRNIDPWRKWYHSFVDRTTLPWTDLIISNSYAGKQRLIENERISPDKIIVIPNGIEICSKIRRTLRSITHIGVLASLTSKKGHVYLIEAFSQLLKTYSNLTLHIAGDGPLKDDLMQMCESKQIHQAVIFEGFISDKLPWYEKIDLFILPSLWEGMPVCILEAMAAELPVIATNVGGVPELIEDSINGILIPPKSSIAIISACSQLVDHPERAFEIGQANRQRVLEYFTAQKMVSAYENIYKTILK